MGTASAVEPGPTDRPAAFDLSEAVRRLDARGRFTRTDARRIRATFRLLKRRGGLPGFDHPRAVLGEWSRLPEGVRTYIRGLVEGYLRASLRFHPRGRLWPAAVRGLYTLSRGLHGRRWAAPFRRLLDWFAAAAWARPGIAAARAEEMGRRLAWAVRPRPTLRQLLAALRVSPNWLAGDYATGVAVDRRCHGYFHDSERDSVAGYLLGLDLIPAPDGVWCIEANLGAALRADRERFYDVDPVGEGLLDLTAELGLERLVWLGAGRTALNPWLYGQMYTGAARRGVGLEVLEGPRLPPRRDLPRELPVPHRALFPPWPPPPRALVAHTRGWRFGPAAVATHKASFIRALTAAFRARGETRARVGQMSAEPGEVRTPDDPGLPNLVYKYPGEDKGQGVHFFRARDAEHARALARAVDARVGEGRGLFQPWVCSRLLEERRFYDVRSFVFVSPVAVRYLGGLRYETARSLPTRLPFGEVEDRRPFTMSFYFGNDYAPLPEAETAEIRDATLAVGEALAAVLSAGFITRPVGV